MKYYHVCILLKWLNKKFVYLLHIPYTLIILSFIKWIDVDASKLKQTIPLSFILALRSIIVCSKSNLFKPTSTTLKSSVQAEFPFIRSNLSRLDFWRLAPKQYSMPLIFDLSSMCSIVIVAISVPGSSSWSKVKSKVVLYAVRMFS